MLSPKTNMSRDEALTIQQREVESLIATEKAETFLATAHFYFHNFDETPVAILKPDSTGQLVSYFFNKEALAKYDELAKQREENRNIARRMRESDEKALERRIVEKLKRQGLKVKQQVATKFGVIDILVDDGESIIEVKSNRSIDSLFKAIGQLVLYSADFPKAKLFIALSEPLAGDVSAVLNARGFGEWK